jgi:hypothetical protein
VAEAIANGGKPPIDVKIADLLEVERGLDEFDRRWSPPA